MLFFISISGSIEQNWIFFPMCQASDSLVNTIIMVCLYWDDVHILTFSLASSWEDLMSFPLLLTLAWLQALWLLYVMKKCNLTW